MVNKYSLEILEAFNSLEEDFAIWECKIMVLEHNLLIQEAFVKQTIKNGTAKASEKLNNARNSFVDKSFNTDQKANKLSNTGKNTVAKVNILKSSRDKLIKLFKDIHAKFIGIFKKFREVAIRLVKKDQAWLNQYKDTILNTDLTKFNYQHEMFAYWSGTQYFNKLIPRPLNPNDKEQMKALESVDSYRQYLIDKHLPTKATQFKKSDNYINSLKHVFRGESVAKLKPTQLQDMLKGMIEYCMKYKDIDKELKKELDNITKACKEAENQAKKINPSQAVNNSDPNNDRGNVQESFFLFFESPTDPASNKDIAQNNKQNMENAKKTINKNINSGKVDNNPHVEQINKITSQSSPQEIISELNKYKIYLNVCSTVTSTKLEIIEEKYHAYMDLLKAVVNLGLYQSKERQDSGMSYNNRTEQIENSKAPKTFKKIKQKERNTMK